MVENLEVVKPLSNSDHNIIRFELVYKSLVNTDNKINYAYHKGDFISMNVHLSAIDWDKELSCVNANEMWIKFCNVMNDSIKVYVPVCKNNKKKYPGWMTKSIKKSRNNKIKMWSRYRKNKSYNNFTEYKRALNKATAAYKSEKKSFEKQLSSKIKTNPKMFYSYVRSKE